MKVRKRPITSENIGPIEKYFRQNRQVHKIILDDNICVTLKSPWYDLSMTLKNLNSFSDFLLQIWITDIETFPKHYDNIKFESLISFSKN